MADVIANFISLQYGPAVPNPAHPAVLYPDGVVEPYNLYALGHYRFFDSYEKDIQIYKGDILTEANRVTRLGVEFNLHLGNFTGTDDPDWSLWLFVMRFMRNPWRVVRFPEVQTGDRVKGLDVGKLTTFLEDASNSASLVLTEDPELEIENHYIKSATFTLFLNRPMSIDDINALP